MVVGGGDTSLSSSSLAAAGRMVQAFLGATCMVGCSVIGAVPSSERDIYTHCCFMYTVCKISYYII